MIPAKMKYLKFFGELISNPDRFKNQFSLVSTENQDENLKITVLINGELKNILSDLLVKPDVPA